MSRAVDFSNCDCTTTRCTKINFVQSSRLGYVVQRHEKCPLNHIGAQKIKILKLRFGPTQTVKFTSVWPSSRKEKRGEGMKHRTAQTIECLEAPFYPTTDFDRKHLMENAHFLNTFAAANGNPHL